MGRRLGVAAVGSVADQYATPVEIAAHQDGSATPSTGLPRAPGPSPEPELAAAMQEVTIPLMPHPELAEVSALREQYDADLEVARASGDYGKVKVAYYSAGWARKIEAQLRDGTAPTSVTGRVNAVEDRRWRHRDGAGRDLHRVSAWP